MSETITIDRKVISDIIEEIEDKIEELEFLISPEIVREAERRDEDIGKGDFVSETEVKGFFKKKGVKLER